MEKEREKERKTEQATINTHYTYVCVCVCVCKRWSHVLFNSCSVVVVHSLHSLDVYLEHYNPLTCAISFQQQCQQQNNHAQIYPCPLPQTT